MSRPSLAGGPWRLIQAGGPHGGGNELLLWQEGETRALLKIYHRRQPWPQQLIKRASCRILEARIGVTAAERCAIEHEALTLWAGLGFDVPALLDRPLPEGLEASTSIWMEFVEGELLSTLLAAPERPLARKLEWIVQLAREAGRRHAAAAERDDVRLLVEHASVKHLIASGERLVQLDLETRFDDRLSTAAALARELSSTLRSLVRHAPGDFEALATRFLRAHPFPSLLREAAVCGLSKGLIREIRRRADERRRAPGQSKTHMLRWALATLDAAPIAGSHRAVLA